MANIPLLKQRNATANTSVIDTSKLVQAQQQGISDFSAGVQGIIKKSAGIIDSKIYESDSANAQKEVLEFMSQSNNEKDKADYYTKHKTMAGFHTDRAKRNIDNIEKRLAKVSHPKARKELENKLVFQAQKSMVGDLSDENRSIKQETNRKEQDKNHILGVEVMGMKSPTNDVEFSATLQNRVNDIDKQVSEGLIDPMMAENLKIDVKDTGNSLRARALVEGGNPLQAMQQAKYGDFGTLSARMKSMAYVQSKHLDGKQKEYQAIKAETNLMKARDEAIVMDIDFKVQNLKDDDKIQGVEKLKALAALKAQYKGVLSGKGGRIFDSASSETSKEMINGVMARVNSLDIGETDTALYKGSVNALQGLSVNPDVPASIQKQATNAMKQIQSSQKLHEKLVEKNAYKQVLSERGGKNRHNRIISTMMSVPKYRDLPVEGKVEVYELLRDGRDKKYLELKSSYTKVQGTNNKVSDLPYSISATQALESYKRDPKRFEAITKRAILNKKSNGFLSGGRTLTPKEAKTIYDDFKRSFDDYRQKVDNFETLESQILNRYKTDKVDK